MHEIEVLLQVKIGIIEDKKVTVGNIATAIKYLGIEPNIAEQIIQTIEKKKWRGIVAANTVDTTVNNVINEQGLPTENL